MSNPSPITQQQADAFINAAVEAWMTTASEHGIPVSVAVVLAIQVWISDAAIAATPETLTFAHAVMAHTSAQLAANDTGETGKSVNWLGWELTEALARRLGETLPTAPAVQH